MMVKLILGAIALGALVLIGAMIFLAVADSRPELDDFLPPDEE